MSRSRTTSRVPRWASTAGRRSARRSAGRSARFSASVAATPAGDGSTSVSARSAGQSASSRQLIFGVLAPTPRGSNPTRSNRRLSGLSASRAGQGGTSVHARCARTARVHHQGADRARRVARWRRTAICATVAVRGRVVQRNLQPGALEALVGVGDPVLGGPRTAHTAPRTAAGRRSGPAAARAPVAGARGRSGRPGRGRRCTRSPAPRPAPQSAGGIQAPAPTVIDRSMPAAM